MDEVAHHSGATVLFVSHQMAPVRSLCSRALLIENGRVLEDGAVQGVLARYLVLNSSAQSATTALPDGEEEEIIGSLELSRHGPNTISSKKALASELEQIRDEGLAVDDEELAAEVQAIAAPVRSEGGEVIAAVNLVGARSTITVDELVVSLSPHLVSTADRISSRLGYRRADEEN